MTAAEPNKRFKIIDGLKMAYVDTDPQAPSGAPVLWFQHGNPTSSYLWRNIITPLAPYIRCIAPDLIGMGDSEKLDSSGPKSYGFSQHFHYLSALLSEVVGDAPVVPVVHDWGSALGFHWTQRHAGRVPGLAYMEAITQPLTWDDWPQNAREIFMAMRRDGGEEMVLEKNIFVERILPSSIQRQLLAEEMAVYRRPFLLKGEDRRPTLTWPREIPINGEPAGLIDLVASYGQFLRSSEIPKLFINAEPGSILVGAQRDFCRTWSNQEEVTVSGSHFLQEDSAADIARVLQVWLRDKGLIAG